jgi:hypothetical protein
MSITVTKTVTTADGVTHKNKEDAKKHIWGVHLTTLGEASAEDIEDAIDNPGNPEVALLREAVREVYLRVWPRANLGVPRGKKSADAA